MTGKHEILMVQVFDTKDAMLMMYPCVDQFTNVLSDYIELVKEHKCHSILIRHPEYTKDYLIVRLTTKDFSAKTNIPENNLKQPS
jgi:hypothetical protein